MLNYLFPSRSFSRPVWVLFFANMVSTSGFAMILPFISIYYIDQLHVTAAEVGTFFLIATIIRSVTELLAGELSDTIGRRKLLIHGQLWRGILFLTVIPAMIFNLGFWIISSLLFCSYFFAALYQPSMSAAIADVTKPDERIEAFSFTRVGGNAGWAIGPAIGGFLASFHYEFLFLFGGILCISSSIWVFYQLKETKSSNENQENKKFDLQGMFNELRNNPYFLFYCLNCIVLFLMIAQLISTFSVFAHEFLKVGNFEIGLIYGINGLLIVLFQVKISSLTRIYNPVKIIIFGTILYSLAYLSLSWSNGTLYLMVSMIFITFGEILVAPTSLSYVSNLAPENKQGRYIGIYSLFTVFAWSIAPNFGLSLMSFFNDKFYLWITIGLTGLFSAGGFALLNFYQKDRK